MNSKLPLGRCALWAWNHVIVLKSRLYDNRSKAATLWAACQSQRIQWLWFRNTQSAVCYLEHFQSDSRLLYNTTVAMLTLLNSTQKRILHTWGTFKGANECQIYHLLQWCDPTSLAKNVSSETGWMSDPAIGTSLCEKACCVSKEHLQPQNWGTG